MHCTLLIPGLFWPRSGADEVAHGLEVPALLRLLARADAQRFAPITPEGWLCQAFQIEREQDWPVAPLTLELDGGEPDDAYWLRADPVHMKIERNRLLLVDNALFDLQHEEAQALASALNAHFERDGLAFHAPHPKRWYVKVARTPALVTHSMNEAAGHDVKPYLPEGADAQQHVTDPRALADLLGQAPDAASCVVRNLYRYATAHIETSGEEPAITKLTDEIFKPNGLCFSPDYKKLYVADTGASHYPDAPKNIKVWDVVGGTKLSGGKEFTSMELNGQAGFADGPCLSAGWPSSTSNPARRWKANPGCR